MKTALRIAASTAAVTLAAISIGYDDRRVAQLSILALPGIAVLLVPAQTTGKRILRAAIAWLWTAAFVVDGVLRGYFEWAHQAAPDSSVVHSAMAGTSTRETEEFLAMYKAPLAIWGAVLAALLLTLSLLLRRSLTANCFVPRAYSLRITGTVLVIAGVLCSSAYLVRSWRNLHPVIYWSEWAANVQDLRARWSDMASEREALLWQAKVTKPYLKDPGPSTVLLVLGESINRDNMSLYGYPRETTPSLKRLVASLGSDVVVLKNAWSSDASTVPSVRKMLQFGNGEPGAGRHLVALARAAGYRVWWISNQDDVTIDQEHAQLADHVHMFNRKPGRNSTSLDEVLLPDIEAALKSPEERKFIIVHMMGAHPHYSRRFPEGENPFDDTLDSVDKKLADEGFSPWTSHFREEYDAAVLYHDKVVSRMLEMVAQLPQKGYKAAFYLSDHGQEVGHEADRAGHSQTTAAGYKIPAIIWQNDSRSIPVDRLQTRGFRSDWAGWTLVHLLGIGWSGWDGSRDVLSHDYRWQDPILPTRITNFIE